MRLKYLSLIIFISYSSSVLSQQERPTESGFSGDLLIGVVYSQSESLMTAGTDNQVLTSLNDSADSDRRGLPGLLGNLYYTFDSLSDQVYVGVSRSKAVDGQFSPEIGYRRLLDGRSSFTLAYIPNLIKRDTYSDPFVVNEKRDETDQSLSVTRAKWESIANTGLGIELAYGDLDLDTEKSGEFLDLTRSDRDLLKRDATYGYANIELKFPIAKGIFFNPNIYAFDRKAEGDAYSYKAVGAELGLFAQAGRHSYSANVRYAQYRYQDSHPIFNKKRDDRQSSLFAAYFYSQPFGWDNTTYTVISNYNDRSSNIGFYQSKGFTVATGINWKF